MGMIWGSSDQKLDGKHKNDVLLHETAINEQCTYSTILDTFLLLYPS